MVYEASPRGNAAICKFVSAGLLFLTRARHSALFAVVVVALFHIDYQFSVLDL